VFLNVRDQVSHPYRTTGKITGSIWLASVQHNDETDTQSHCISQPLASLSLFIPSQGTYLNRISA
jgi:hypothetical protein